MPPHESLAQTKSVYTIFAPSELTFFNVSQWKKKILSPLTVEPQIEIDLSGITRIDFAGLQLLVAAKKEAIRQGANLRMTHRSLAASSAMSLCGLTSYLCDEIPPKILECCAENSDGA